MDLIELKKQHGKLFCVVLNELEIVFKLPTWGEYKAYTLLLQNNAVLQVYIYDSIFQSCVISENVIDVMYQLPAGIVESIVNLILFLAGNPLESESDLVRLNNDIDTIRSVISTNIYDQFIIIICQAFPSYTPEMLDGLEWAEMLRLLLMAENILMRRGEIENTVNIVPQDERKENLADKIMNDTKSLQGFDPDLANRPTTQMTTEERRLATLEYARQRKLRGTG